MNDAHDTCETRRRCCGMELTWAREDTSVIHRPIPMQRSPSRQASQVGALNSVTMREIADVLNTRGRGATVERQLLLRADRSMCRVALMVGPLGNSKHR